MSRIDIDQLYRKHGAHALRRAGALLRDEDEALETVQEIFMNLLEKPGQFRGESSFSTWLYRTVTNRCLNRIRDSKNRERLLIDNPPPPDVAELYPIDKLIDLDRLLSRIPNELARVAVYYYLDEMTQDEIAQVLKSSRRHVGNLIERMHGEVARLKQQPC